MFKSCERSHDLASLGGGGGGGGLPNWAIIIPIRAPSAPPHLSRPPYQRGHRARDIDNTVGINIRPDQTIKYALVGLE